MIETKSYFKLTTTIEKDEERVVLCDSTIQIEPNHSNTSSVIVRNAEAYKLNIEEARKQIDLHHDIHKKTEDFINGMKGI